MVITLEGADFSQDNIGTITVGLDADTKAIFQYYTRFDESSDVAIALDNVVRYLKSIGVWSNLQYFNAPCLSATKSQALYNFATKQALVPTNDSAVSFSDGKVTVSESVTAPITPISTMGLYIQFGGNSYGGMLAGDSAYIALNKTATLFMNIQLNANTGWRWTTFETDVTRIAAVTALTKLRFGTEGNARVNKKSPSTFTYGGSSDESSISLSESLSKIYIGFSTSSYNEGIVMKFSNDVVLTNEQIDELHAKMESVRQAVGV